MLVLDHSDGRIVYRDTDGERKRVEPGDALVSRSVGPVTFEGITLACGDGDVVTFTRHDGSELTEFWTSVKAALHAGNLEHEAQAEKHIAGW